MPRDQVFIGVAIALLCLVGLWKDRWFLANTRKGQRLVGWFGEKAAIWGLRFFLALGVLFGIRLSADMIRPVVW